MMEPAIASPPQIVRPHIRFLYLFVCLAPSFIVLVSAFVPLVRKFDPNDLDWLPLLSDSFMRGLAWGRQVVFTYGPWGFVWTGYEPRTFALLCVFWLWAAVTTWGVMWRMARKSFAETPWAMGLILLVFALSLGGDYNGSPGARLMLLPALLLLYHFFSASPGKLDFAELGLVALIAFSGLVKFSYAISGVFAVALVCIDSIKPIRFRSLPLITFTIAFLLGWLLAGQSLTDLPAFIGGSFELTRGYEEAMTSSSPNEFRQAAMYVVLCVLLLGALVPIAIRKLRWQSPSFLVGVVGLIFIAFKSGYVRHDDHEIIATGFIFPAILAASLAVWPHIQRWPGRVMCGICIIAGMLTLSASLSDWEGEYLVGQVGYTLSNVASESAELGSLAAGHPSRNFDHWQNTMRAIVNAVPFPPVNGTVDLFTRESTALLAHGMDYRPRPTLLSYAAYNAALSRRNASYLAGPNAPDNLFFLVDFFGSNVPSLDDNLCWMEILSRYEVANTKGRYLQLAKRISPRLPKLIPLADQTARLGAALQLPSREIAVSPMIWAQVKLTRRPLGALWAKLYKPPEVVLNIQLTNGQTLAATIVPDNAAEGFLLGPLVVDNATFVAIDTPGNDPQTWRELMPAAIMVSGANGTDIGWYLDDVLHIKLFGLRFETAK